MQSVAKELEVGRGSTVTISWETKAAAWASGVATHENVEQCAISQAQGHKQD
jgi:hypothetical protein